MFKRKLLIYLGAVLLLCACLLGYAFKRNYVAPIIMYHSVSPGGSWENRLTVSPETFRRQMHFLRKQRYNILPLEDLGRLIKNKKKIPARTVAVTFDDGYKDNYQYAFPIIKEYDIPVTVFVIIEEVGRPDRLSWEEIIRMRDSGVVAFGSHAVGPAPLVNIVSDEELKKQIFDSRKILEERLGIEVRMFSYPEGRFNDKIKQLVTAAGYGLAVATNPGKDYPDDDVFALKRLRISENAKNLLIFAIEASGYYNFIREHRHK